MSKDRSGVQIPGLFEEILEEVEGRRVEVEVENSKGSVERVKGLVHRVDGQYAVTSQDGQQYRIGKGGYKIRRFF